MEQKDKEAMAEGHISADVATAKREWSEWAADWVVTFTQTDSGSWMARLPFREVYAEGATKDEATAGLFRVYCGLARDGSINVEFPHRVGAPPIQHAIEILEEQLRFHVRCRFDDWRELALPTELQPTPEEQKPDERTTAGGMYTRDPRFNRRNEVLSGLATAIAALARVREL